MCPPPVRAAAPEPDMPSPSPELVALTEALIGPIDSIGSFVNGHGIAGRGQTIDIVDPATGAVALTYHDVDAATVARAIEGAHEGQRAWAALAARDRARVLRKIAAAIEANAETLARMETISSGKVLKGSRAQMALVVDMFEYYAGWADKFTGDIIPVPGGQLNYTLREPLGVVLQVTPWNSPLYLAAWNAVPAIAMGNAVLLKPSEFTPLTALAMARIAVDAGLPPGVLNVLGGLGQSSAQPAIDHPLVKKVVFVGSTATGRRVAAQAASRPIACLLELGGKSANIVFDDADLDAAADAALVAGYANTGQNCAAGSRLLVQRPVYDRFLDLLATRSQGYRIGAPLDADTDIGPVINVAQRDRIRQMVEIGIGGGARLLVGGAAPVAGFDAGYYVQPTILVDVDNDMPIARQEVFGPVIAVIPFDTEADAVRIANDSEFGLAGGVWTRDIARGHRVAAQINAGLCWINMYRDMHVSSPFGGNDSSGYGRSSGVECLYEYTRTKSVWLPTRLGQ